MFEHRLTLPPGYDRASCPPTDLASLLPSLPPPSLHPQQQSGISDCRPSPRPGPAGSGLVWPGRAGACVSRAVEARELARLSHQASESFEFNLSRLYLDASARPYDHLQKRNRRVSVPINQANNRSINVCRPGELQVTYC